jgi:hypothetical protein
VAGLVEAAKGSKELSKFSGRYLLNMVRIKYYEVKALLISDDAGLTGMIYKGNSETLLHLMAEMIHTWGSCRSADEFLSKFLLADLLQPLRVGSMKNMRNILNDSNILSEFYKHFDLIPEFAGMLDDEFRTSYGAEHGSTTEKLVAFLVTTGPKGPRVASFVNWIELMSVTGMLHSSAQSGSRLCSSAVVLKYLNEERPWFYTLENPNGDGYAIKVFLATTLGVVEDHSVFSEIIKNLSPLISNILKNFDGMSEDYKKEFCKRIKENMEEFLLYGWLYTDYCNDMTENKQSTVTTYV